MKLRGYGMGGTGKLAAALVLGALLPLGAAAPALAQQAPAAALAQVNELRQVAGAVWRFRSNDHYGLVMVTPTGAVVVDPLNAPTAAWLKDELSRRFNGLKVVEVVYSHHDWDHATGAAVFGAVPIVSRAETLKELQPPADPARREAFQKQFSGVVAPTETFTGAVRQVTLGGHTLELHAVQSRHASDLSFIWFPAEKILFTVDVLSPHRIAFRNMGDYEPADADRVLDKALTFNATHVVGGHGEIGTPKDITALKQYYADLRAAVADGLKQGLTLDQIKKQATLEAYRDWGDYAAFREMNIEGMYRVLTARPS